MEFRERKKRQKPGGNPFDDDDGFDKPLDDEEIAKRKKGIDDIVDDALDDKDLDKVTKRKEKSGE